MVISCQETISAVSTVQPTCHLLHTYVDINIVFYTSLLNGSISFFDLVFCFANFQYDYIIVLKHILTDWFWSLNGDIITVIYYNCYRQKWCAIM